jgi:hypothetical protein
MLANRHGNTQKTDNMQIAREHIVPLLFACFFLTGIVHANGSLDPYPDAGTAPEFALADLDNKQHRLSEYRGKVVLVNFWASRCVPCLREMPGMQRMADSLRDRPFEILAINVAEQQGAPCAPKRTCKLLIHGAHGAPYRHGST